MTKRLAFALAGLLVAVGACGPDGGDDVPDCEAALLAGQLVITEVMANPDGDDAGNEWFEIYNTTSDTLNLEGLVLTASREDGTSEDEHVMTETAIGPGEYFTLGGVLQEFAPSHIDYGYGSDLGSLLNSAGKLSVKCDVVVVDDLIYEEMTDGVARGLDGNIAPDYMANDTLTNWCDATGEYDASGNRGSPGEPNENCSIVMMDECDDNGMNRMIVDPVAGDLVITELMPNPDAADDATGEWFEVMVTASADIDLNNLVAGRVTGTATESFSDAACVTASPGDYLLFARTTDTVTNGGMDNVDFTYGFSLVNSNGTMFIGIGDSVLDEITWTSSPSGASIQLDPDFANPADNDIEAFWCDGATAYGDGDLGTPGAANEECVIAVPTVVSAVATSLTEVIVTFDRDILDASITNVMAQFTFDNGLTASAASVSGPDVTLTTSMQTGGVQYIVTVADTVTDLAGLGVDPANNTATFSGYQTPAVVRINEIAASESSGCDLIELRVISAGTLEGFEILERNVSLLTFGALTVAVDDLVIVHLDGTDTANCNVNDSANETNAVDEQPVGSFPNNFDTAYDWYSTDTGIVDTTNVITVLDPVGTIVDGVLYADAATGTAAAGSETQAAILAGEGEWQMVGGGVPMNGFVDDDFRMHAVLDSDAADSMQRIDNTDDNDKADWTAANVTATFGALNAGQ
jgi:hypothetical protein